MRHSVRGADALFACLAEVIPENASHVLKASFAANLPASRKRSPQRFSSLAMTQWKPGVECASYPGSQNIASSSCFSASTISASHST
ncbi:hypothetical protein PCAR4_100033 [Paraburkholderia caribensis]|nr:hypothetical protein PCAR4_100033 [Paraburkholderia caribensis]